MASLSAVEAFVAVAERRSFSKAARALGLSPAAVSRSVKRLEAELGTELVHRTTRSVELSREGLAPIRQSSGSFPEFSFDLLVCQARSVVAREAEHGCSARA